MTDPYPGAFRFGKIEIDYLTGSVDASRYIGLPGQVQDICDEELLVCGDQQHLLLREVQIEGQDRLIPSIYFCEKLSIDVINILKR